MTATRAVGTPGLDDHALAALADRLFALMCERFGAPSAAGGVLMSRLHTKRETASYFAVTTAQVDRWVRRSMPRAVVGASPRFDLAACRAWLAENAQPRSTPVTRQKAAPSCVTLLSRRRGA